MKVVSIVVSIVRLDTIPFRNVNQNLPLFCIEQKIYLSLSMSRYEGSDYSSEYSQTRHNPFLKCLQQKICCSCGKIYLSLCRDEGVVSIVVGR
jgi:hypothetical protein